MKLENKNFVNPFKNPVNPVKRKLVLIRGLNESGGHI
jgi:hypothetical protein